MNIAPITEEVTQLLMNPQFNEWYAEQNEMQKKAAVAMSILYCRSIQKEGAKCIACDGSGTISFGHIGCKTCKGTGHEN